MPERPRRPRSSRAVRTPPKERQQERAASAARRPSCVGAVGSRPGPRRATPAQATTPPRERIPGVQKVRQGIVVSDKADKTITVRIDLARRHRRY